MFNNPTSYHLPELSPLCPLLGMLTLLLLPMCIVYGILHIKLMKKCLIIEMEINDYIAITLTVTNITLTVLKSES